MANVNRIPFNTIPQEWAFHPTIGPFIRDLLTIIWQQRNRTGGDSDAIGDYEVRITSLENADVVLDSRLDTAEADISALESSDVVIDARLDTAESDITLLQAADVLLDGRLDTAESTLITIDGRVEALESAPGTHAGTVEYDFGALPVYEAQFTITDATITGTSVINVALGGAATGRSADDWQWDGATVGVVAGTGSATCYVTFHPGPIVGPRTFNYVVI